MGQVPTDVANLGSLIAQNPTIHEMSFHDDNPLYVILSHTAELFPGSYWKVAKNCLPL